MANSGKPKEWVFGGWLGTIGIIIGTGLGYDLTHHWVGALVGFLAGAFVGIAMEVVIFQALVIAFGIMIILARHEMLQAFFQ